MFIFVGSEYAFLVISDDGFELRIDDKKVSGFESDRAPDSTRAARFLRKGGHTLKLKYFQGGGGMTLRASYTAPSGKAYLIGQSSDAIRFDKKK